MSELKVWRVKILMPGGGEEINVQWKVEEVQGSARLEYNTNIHCIDIINLATQNTVN